jgi:hypothetical protein
MKQQIVIQHGLMFSKQKIDTTSIITKHGFSNDSSWPTSFFLLMDMSISTRGSKHVCFD